MKTRNLITAAVITLGMSASAQAAPQGLDSLLSRLVSHAVTMTVEEMKNEVTETVLNTTHHFESDTPKGTVEIIEIAAVDTQPDSE